MSQSELGEIKKGVAALAERVATLELQQKGAGFASLEGRVTSLEGRFTSLEGRFTSLEARIEKMDENNDRRFNRIDHEVRHVRSGVDTLVNHLKESS